ncbi:hypothetical protein ACFL5N_01965, partial [bacterium]
FSCSEMLVCMNDSPLVKRIIEVEENTSIKKVAVDEDTIKKIKKELEVKRSKYKVKRKKSKKKKAVKYKKEVKKKQDTFVPVKIKRAKNSSFVNLNLEAGLQHDSLAVIGEILLRGRLAFHYGMGKYAPDRDDSKEVDMKYYGGAIYFGDPNAKLRFRIGLLTGDMLGLPDLSMRSGIYAYAGIRWKFMSFMSFNMDYGFRKLDDKHIVYTDADSSIHEYDEENSFLVSVKLGIHIV